jgi:hypothetical protein
MSCIFYYKNIWKQMSVLNCLEYILNYHVKKFYVTIFSPLHIDSSVR